ncbi:hypothetical protein [Rheinheimera sp. UJ63]|uniref:hypothetical protein n=1 Tax=Rheinheimera sp. UJ63 TaxID=2910157 RepID=UPI001F2E14FD|nr:hypothetical protein [Rheinheimera sp. UJ63]MCF4009568.1 hypothetical protein [Rheinheimera sp. UJ63]
MWFAALTGFKEQGAAQIRQLLQLEGDYLRSKVNGLSYKVGSLITPSLAELHTRAAAVLQQPQQPLSHLQLREVVADAQALHADPKNAGALFQVASQFNLLEMVSPTITPDSGITNYQFDKTQGPACAMACGAGLIYRNYFVPVQGKLGQTAERQLDMLDDFADALLSHIKTSTGRSDQPLWLMKNGYALPTQQQLLLINQALTTCSSAELAQLRGRIKIGLQLDTQVTLKGCFHAVSQAYCSAMPVAYSQHSTALWQPLATLVLQAAYEATLAAAVVNAAATGNKTLYLTLLGGGAFGNPTKWIIQAISAALEQYKHSGLTVNIVSYGASKPEVQALLNNYNAVPTNKMSGPT